MCKVPIPVAVIALAIAAAALGGRSENAAAAPASCAKANLSLVKVGLLSIGTDNPAFPPWFARGETKGRPWKINDPAKGKGFESAVAYAVAKRLGFAKSEVVGVYTPFNRTIAPGRKQFDLPRRGDALRRDHDPARSVHRLARRPRPAQAAGGEPRVTAVKIEGLRKSFGKVEVLRGIDLDVAEHEASVPRRARPRQQPPTFERKDQPD